MIQEQAGILHIQENQGYRQRVLNVICQYESDRKERIQRLASQEKDEKTRRLRTVLEWFAAAPSTAQDHQICCDIRKGNIGSGDWILQDSKVQNWMDPDIPISSTLWINGIPGAGMISLFLMHNTQMVLIHHYC